MPTDADFLAAILSEPADTPRRLIYADFLEERGQPGDGERAEFIRVQCELSKAAPCTCFMYGCDELYGDSETQGCEPHKKRNRLHRRERELRESEPNHKTWIADIERIAGEAVADADYSGERFWTPRWYIRFRRGFVSHLTLTAADWLQHADDLAWHPSQEMECEKCKGNGWGDGHIADTDCVYCHGKGRLPRPMPATAVPLEEIAITTDLDWIAPYMDGTIVLIAEGTNYRYRCWKAKYRDHWGDPGPMPAWILKAEWPWIKFSLPRE